MKITNKIKFAAITLLLLAGSATQALADDWGFYDYRADILNPYNTVTTKSFSDLKTDYAWASQTKSWWMRTAGNGNWKPDYGMFIGSNAYHGYTNANDLFVEISIWYTTRDVPSYAKLVRTVDFQQFTQAAQMHHGIGLYIFEDLNTAVSTQLDATYTQGLKSSTSTYGPEGYMMIKTFNMSTEYSNTSLTQRRLLTYDNSSKVENHNISKYIAFVHSAATSSAIKDFYWFSTWHEIAVDSAWYYYKYISFEANGGTGAAMVEQTIENSGNLTANNYTRAGYRFIGWNTQTDGKGTAYTDGQAVTATLEDKGPVTLYAQWALDLQMSDSGYSTVFSDKNLVVPAGVEVYGFTYNDGVLIQGDKISEGAILPAYNGYVVKATAAGTYSFVTTSAAATVPASDITGTTAEIDAPTTEYVYVWGQPTGYNYGWYRYTGQTIPAGKAYFISSFIENGVYGKDINSMNVKDHKAW